MKKLSCLAVLFACGSLFATTAQDIEKQAEVKINEKQQEMAQALYRAEAPKPEIACKEDRWFLMDDENKGIWRQECHYGVVQQPVDYFHENLERQFVGLAGAFNKDLFVNQDIAPVPDFFDDDSVSFLQHCDSSLTNISRRQLLNPEDPAVVAILERAVNLYNENHVGEPQMRVPNMQTDHISVANLMHAIYIIHKYGNEDRFSAQAVCMLGKTIGAASKDLKVGKGNGYKKNLSNMFGAFAAYMGVDSMYYPGAYVTVNGKAEQDVRFGPTRNKFSKYYWEDYNLEDPTFKRSLHFGPWLRDEHEPATLQEIADAVNFNVNRREPLSVKRQKYWEAYKTLLTGKDSCEVREDATVSYQKILEYLHPMCIDNRVLQMKPTHDVPDHRMVLWGNVKQ